MSFTTIKEKEEKERKRKRKKRNERKPRSQVCPRQRPPHLCSVALCDRQTWLGEPHACHVVPSRLSHGGHPPCWQWLHPVIRQRTPTEARPFLLKPGHRVCAIMGGLRVSLTLGGLPLHGLHWALSLSAMAPQSQLTLGDPVLGCVPHACPS